MELKLQSPLTLVLNAFHVLVGPEEMLVDSLNYNLDKLDRRFTELDVRRAFTVHQLLTILKEAYQTLIILEL